ncbi:MAG: SDR family NAD(P)-dependent oxidoreductase [Myxococcales bacterium]|nr:MAG: SDR family NAD(P)-dependent oxidoreductase [Myxococcales bacterium]
MSRMDKDLSGKIALVAGATRGAGRAIAVALGEAGATVYATGRSSREHPGQRPEVIEETAALVDQAGGRGVAVRVDHTREPEVAALAERIRRDHGGLDILVNDIWGGESLVEFGVPFWECSVDKGRTMLEQAVLTHAITSRHAVPLMLDRAHGLIVEVTDGDTFGWRGALFYDVVKMSVIRLAFAMSRELRDRPLTALALTPGFLRSEEMLDHFGVREDNWRDAGAREPLFLGSESPGYVGRAVAALARDPGVKQRCGRVFSSWELAREYGFTDRDGTQPHWGEYFAKAYGRPYRRADEAAYASWLDGPMEVTREAGGTPLRGPDDPACGGLPRSGLRRRSRSHGRRRRRSPERKVSRPRSRSQRRLAAR